MATNTELLAQADAAISAILSGFQSHQYQGRVFTRANLADLWTIRQDLDRLVKTEAAGGVRVQFVEPC